MTDDGVTLFSIAHPAGDGLAQYRRIARDALETTFITLSAAEMRILRWTRRRRRKQRIVEARNRAERLKRMWR